MRADVRLPPEPSSVRLARRFVVDTLGDAGVADDDVDTAQLLVSELATNAVLHARTSFVVAVEHQPGAVRVEVVDDSARAPRARGHSVESGTGRGLQLLAHLAMTWGVEPHDGGKSVWFTVPAATAAAGARADRTEETSPA